MSDWNRRDSLRWLGGVAASGWPGVQLLAAPAAGAQRLLVVMLRGAYDATNTLIPYSSSFYYEARPNLAIAKPGSDALAALELTADWGLHPALRTSLLPLWQAKSLAFVPFSGLEDPSRSHFEMQDKIEFGRGSRFSDYSSGFLNRLAAELSPTSRALAFTNTLPPILRGSVRVPNIALERGAIRAMSAQEMVQVEQISRMYEDTPLAAPVREGFETRQRVQQELAGEMEAASRGATSPRGLALAAPRIAKLLRDSYRIGFIDVGRWDTHVAQGGATGMLADRLSELGDGLALLARELGDAWAHTTVVVVSEFGRTFRENGNRGTDHGHGSALWVLGGSVRGGRVLGEQVASQPQTLNDNRDWPVLNDYRAVLAGLFGRWYGLSPAALARVFPGAPPQDVGLI
jgi:uncharacterized protein (DUF1501 family)